MENHIQLLSFLASFLFGMFFSLMSRFHYKMVYSLHGMFRYVLTFLFILDISLCYVLFMYSINYGMVHFYFVGFVFLGYVCERILLPFVKNHVNFCRFVDKKLRK